MGVEEELEALRNRGVTKKNASKLKDANGLSTPEAEETAIKAGQERTRIANYGKEACDNLKTYNDAKISVLLGDCEGMLLSPKTAKSPREKIQSATAATATTTATIVPQTNRAESSIIDTEEIAIPASVAATGNDASSLLSQREEPSVKRTHTPYSASAQPPSPPSSLTLSTSTSTSSMQFPTPADESTREPEEPKASLVPGLRRFLIASLRSKAMLSTFLISLLISFSIGLTVGIVPEVLTDRYARLYHGYGAPSSTNNNNEGEHNNDDLGGLQPLPPCWEYDTSTMPAACVMGADDAQTGSAYGTLFQNLLTFFFNAVLGSYSDTHGRRSLLIVSVFLNALVPASLVAMELFESMDPFWFYASNAFTGIISYASIAFAMMSDDCPEEHRAGRFAMNMAGFYIGFAIAPMLPMYTSHIVASWWSFAFAAVTLVGSVLFLPETLPALVADSSNNNNNNSSSSSSSSSSNSQHQQQRQSQPISALPQGNLSLERQFLIDGTASTATATATRSFSASNTTKAYYCLQATKTLLLRPFREMTILSRTGVLQLVAIGSFLSAAVYSIDSSLVLFYIEEHLNVREHDIAIMFCLMGIFGAILQGISLQPLVYALGETGLLVITFVSGTIHNLLYGIASTKTEITVALSLSQLTKLSYPLLSSLASQQVGLDEQGRVQGALLGLNALAGAVGPVSMNWVYKHTKDGTHKPFGPGTMFLLSSGLYLLGTFVISFVPSSSSTATDGSNSNNNNTTNTNNLNLNSNSDLNTNGRSANQTDESDGRNCSCESLPWEGDYLEEPLLLRLGETITV